MKIPITGLRPCGGPYISEFVREEIAKKFVNTLTGLTAHRAKEQVMAYGRTDTHGRYWPTLSEKAWILRYLLIWEITIDNIDRNPMAVSQEWSEFFRHVDGGMPFFAKSLRRAADVQMEGIYDRHHESCRCMMQRAEKVIPDACLGFLIGCKCNACMGLDRMDAARHIYRAAKIYWPGDDPQDSKLMHTEESPIIGRFSCKDPNLSNLPRTEPKLGNPICIEEAKGSYTVGGLFANTVIAVGLGSLLRKVEGRPDSFYPHPKLKKAIDERWEFTKKNNGKHPLSVGEYLKRLRLLEPEPRRLQTTTWDPGYGDD